MGKLRLRSRAGQRFIEFSCSLIALGLFLFFVILPLWALFGDLDQGLLRLERRLSKVKTEQSYFKQDGQASIGSKTKLRGIETAQALLEIQQLAGRQNVVIERITLQGDPAADREGRIIVTPLELSLRCSEVSLMRFLREIKRLDFLCRIERLGIAGDPAAGGMVRGRLSLAKIDIVAAGPWMIRTAPELLPFSPARNLFSAASSAGPENTRADAQSPKDVVGNLALVGIINDGTLQAAIEDRKRSRSYFLVQGDVFSGMKVVAIRKNEVILEKDGVSYNLGM